MPDKDPDAQPETRLALYGMQIYGGLAKFRLVSAFLPPMMIIAVF